MAELIPLERISYRITAKTFSEELEPDDAPYSFAIHLPLELRQGDRLVARIHALLIRVSEAARADFTPAQVFHSIDEDGRDLYGALYDAERAALRRDLVRATDLRDVLYIESVKVIPSRRKRKLGLQAVGRVRDLFGGGCAALALKAQPLSTDSPKYEEAIDDEVFSKPFSASGEAAKAKLRAYFGQLDFRRVDQTDFMVFDMSRERPQI